MTHPQQSTSSKRNAAQQTQASAKNTAGKVDTVYLDATVIDPRTSGKAGSANDRRGNGPAFSSFAWSSLDGFQRGWNSAYSEKRTNDPFVTDMPENGPKTSKSEWKRGNMTSGLLQTVAGGAIALAGVPMLILPGPGLLAIGLGGALAANGLRKILGK